MSAKETRTRLITSWQRFRHMTDGAMAGLAGVSLRTWQSWKHSGFDIQASRLSKLCEYLRMPKEDAWTVLTADYPIQPKIEKGGVK